MSHENGVDFTLLTKGFTGFHTFESEALGAQPTTASSLQSGRMGGPSWADLAAQEPMQYVNLQKNPERYTGYTGYTATRIWDAIYEENCFTHSVREGGQSQCFEERVFHRLISGLHASINSHLCRYFYPGDQPNLLLWQHKVGHHADRIQNLYFTFVFVSRAVGLTLPHLQDYNYDSGDPSSDSEIGLLIKHMAQMPLFRADTDAAHPR